jgi:hypothetical protein
MLPEHYDLRTALAAAPTSEECAAVVEVLAARGWDGPAQVRRRSATFCCCAVRLVCASCHFFASALRSFFLMTLAHIFTSYDPTSRRSVADIVMLSIMSPGRAGNRQLVLSAPHPRAQRRAAR